MLGKNLKLILPMIGVLLLGIIFGYFLPHDKTPHVGKTIVEQGQSSGQTLAEIHKRGKIRCGVPQNLPGFAYQNDDEMWHGFNVDFCRALAASIFGDQNKVKFIPLNNTDKFTALQSGNVDLLAHNTSLTIARDANLHLKFSGITYYDAQGFLVPRTLEISSIYQAQNLTACIITGTISAKNLINFFTKNQISYKTVSLDTIDHAIEAYDNERCNLYSTDRTLLAANRTLLKDPSQHILLPEMISSEPLSLVLREGDDNWGDIVNWTINAMILAEELEINSENVQNMRSSENIQIRRLLGKAGEYGKGLGLSEDWAYHIILYVGNYAEIYQRNLGKDTNIGLKRDLNALWRDGGIRYSVPIR